MDAKAAAAAAETHFAPKPDSESPSSSMTCCLGFTVFHIDTRFCLKKKKMKVDIFPHVVVPNNS